MKDLFANVQKFYHQSFDKFGAVQEFGDTGHLVHSGILASAEWLSDRLSCIAQVTCQPCALESPYCSLSNACTALCA